MKKKILLFIPAFILCHLMMGSSNWAMWIPNIGDGQYVYFNRYTQISFSSDLEPCVSYQTLSDICASINSDIAAGSYSKMEPFYSYPSHKFEAGIVAYGSYSPARYVIRLYDRTTTSNAWYYCTTSNYFIYAYRDIDNPNGLKPLYDKVNTISSTLSTISSRVLTISNSLSTLLGYVDGIEGYIDGVEGFLSTQISTLSSISSNTSSIPSLLGLFDGSSLKFGPITKSSGDDLPTSLIPHSVADQIVAYLNMHLIGKSVTILDRALNAYTTTAKYFFLDSNYGMIGVFGANGGVGYLCSSDNVIFYCDLNGSLKDDYYPVLSRLNNIYTALSNINVNTNNSNTHNSNVILKFDSLISATANIDAQLDSLVDNFDINIGSIVDSLDLGFDDVIGAINGLPASNVSGLIPYVDQLEGYTDGIEGLITTGNSNLSSLVSSNNDIVDGITAIQEWLEGRDVLDYEVIRDLIDTWGSSLTYTVLNSDNIIGLFYKAFGDVPSSVDWSRAKNYFDSFYAGGS